MENQAIIGTGISLGNSPSANNLEYVNTNNTLNNPYYIKPAVSSNSYTFTVFVKPQFVSVKRDGLQFYIFFF